MQRIPLRKWTHLAATFSLPNVTTYMDGKKVGQSAWQYPIGFTDPLVLGQWNTEKSHDGLIDELRLYKRALTPAEVALLADRQGRDSGEIKLVPPVQPRTLASFETRCATLTLNEAGWVTSLLQKASGKEGHARELLAAQTPMVTVVVEGNRNVECHKMSVDNGILTATFPGLDGHARLRCESKGDYLKFTALEVTVPRVTSFVFFHCAPGVNQYRGEFAGLVSDDDSGICLRALDLQVNCSTAMSASTSADLGLTGYSAALAAGPRSELRPMLKAMATQEDVPRSQHGGPWAAESPMARLSYLFVQDAFTDTDSWIDLARRGGFGILHFREPWFRTFGDYRPNPKNFPGGMDEMVAAADRLHAAGLKLGLHTLSGCLRTESPYITPVPSQELISLATYTVARDFGKADDTLYVNEPPGDQHATVFTYHGATVGSTWMRRNTGWRKTWPWMPRCPWEAFALAAPPGTPGRWTCSPSSGGMSNTAWPTTSTRRPSTVFASPAGTSACASATAARGNSRRLSTCRTRRSCPGRSRRNGPWTTPAGSSRSGSASRCCSPPFRPTPPRRGRSSTSATHR